MNANSGKELGTGPVLPVHAQAINHAGVQSPLLDAGKQ
jgi:hypothetical protein